MSLRLAQDVFFCAADGIGVFLDLNNDRYSGVSFEEAEGETDNSDFADKFEHQRLQLLDAGLVIEDPGAGSSMNTFLDIAKPVVSIFGNEDSRAFGLAGARGGRVRLSCGDIVDFYRACLSAACSLKRRSIRDVVHAVRARKLKARTVVPDLSLLRREAMIFRRLRPWYPRDYLCLYDSLALIEFLALRHHQVSWIFGVQTQPFGAHCWVQSNGYALNESVEYAGQFTPIMAV